MDNSVIQRLAPEPRTGEGCAATARRGRSRNNEPKAARPRPADSPTAPTPTWSRSKTKRTGDDACTTRAGADSKPLRSPYPPGPNNANGKVPLAIVIMPLPAPCNSANAMIPGAPNPTRNAAPIGCSAEASRAEEIGWNERNNPNSTMRAATWAGPTSDAAAIAAVADAPAACSNPGKCAAIAPCTNQVAAKKNARIGIAARGGSAGGNSIAACGSAAGMPWRGIASQLTGAASSMFKPAQVRQAARQPNMSKNSALGGQPIVLAKPAIRVIPVIELRASRP